MASTHLAAASSVIVGITLRSRYRYNLRNEGQVARLEPISRNGWLVDLAYNYRTGSECGNCTFHNATDVQQVAGCGGRHG